MRGVCLFAFPVINYLSMEVEQKHGCLRNGIGIVAKSAARSLTSLISFPARQKLMPGHRPCPDAKVSPWWQKRRTRV